MTRMSWNLAGYTGIRPTSYLVMQSKGTGLLLGLAIVFIAVPAFAQTEPPKSPPEIKPDPKSEVKPAGPNPRVKLETTLGDIVIEFDAVKAPISTENFLQYTRDHYYDGTIFHRVMSTFMIQGGGFLPTFKKKEGQRPPIKNEWQNGLKNVRGTIAMARTNVPDSATSEFFINVVDNPRLDEASGGAAYAVFGKVVEGMDVVDKIKDAETKLDPNFNPREKAVPVTTIEIKTARIVGEAAKPEK